MIPGPLKLSVWNRRGTPDGMSVEIADRFDGVRLSVDLYLVRLHYLLTSGTDVTQPDINPCRLHACSNGGQVSRHLKAVETARRTRAWEGLWEMVAPMLVDSLTASASISN